MVISIQWNMAHKKEQDVVHDTTGMNLENMLRERSQK